MGGFNRDIGVGIAFVRPAVAKLCEAPQPLKLKAGYKANGTLLIAIFALGFRASRPLIQAMY